MDNSRKGAFFTVIGVILLYGSADCQAEETIKGEVPRSPL